LREDRYYRLNVFHIHRPPLRDRKEDILPIAESLIGLLNSRHECQVTGISQEVQDAFGAYFWPGNVRELRNSLEHAVILAGRGMIERKNLPPTVSCMEAVAAEVGSVDFRIGMTVNEAERS